MAKVTLNNIGSRYGSIDALNDNSEIIEQAFENTLSRDGSGPNNMEANLDMDGHSILNADSVSVDKLYINNTLIVPESSLVEAANANTIDYNPAGTGAVATNVQDKLRQLPSVIDYGAVGDNATFNDSAFNIIEALTAYTTFYVPEGTYKTNLFTLNKRYIGPGKIVFGDNVVQDCAIALREKGRNETGPLTLSSNSDILFDPVGTINANGHRVTGLAPAEVQTDAISFNDLETGKAEGIKFANVANADPKMLDWYEEGTFTPSVVGSSIAGTTTYTRRYGRFTRIGRQVRARIVVEFAVTGSNGFVKITGLPYPGLQVNTPSSGVVHAGYGHGAVANIGYGGSAFQYYWYVNGSEMHIYTSESGGTGATWSDTAGVYDIDVTYDAA
jgi:hypothetical protein